MDGTILDMTARRLIKWGLAEREAFLISQVATLAADASDDTVADLVIKVFIASKVAATEDCTVEYVGGQRRDDVRDTTQLRLK